MTVQELIEILKTCNPESVVHVYVDCENGDYSYGEHDVGVSEDKGVVKIGGEQDEDYCP